MYPLKIKACGMKIIAHRGAPSLAAENTVAAFTSAGVRDYFGIESDVRVTKDGHFVMIHDDTTARVAHQALPVEQSTLAELRRLQLYGLDGRPSAELCIPTLDEYIAVCRAYGKVAVTELKKPLSDADLSRIRDAFLRADYLDKTVFISFFYDNLMRMRLLDETVSLQYLCLIPPKREELVALLSAVRAGADLYYPTVDQALVEACHEAGLAVNAWTVDREEDALRLRDMGVDMLTTNLLE